MRRKGLDAMQAPLGSNEDIPVINTVHSKNILFHT